MKAWARNHHLVAVFMDLEGAFDAIRHSILLFKAREIDGLAGGRVDSVRKSRCGLIIRTNNKLTIN